MTAQETVVFLRMALDDGAPERFSAFELARAVTVAQQDQVALAAQMQDERCLRPLLTERTDLSPDDVVEDCLYARGAVLRRAGDPPSLDVTLTHQQWHILTHTAGDAGAFPGAGWFSIDADRRVRFVAGPGMLMVLSYIRQPADFDGETALELPPEYHPEIALAAAAHLASNDEEEQERRLVRALEGGFWA